MRPPRPDALSRRQVPRRAPTTPARSPAAAPPPVLTSRPVAGKSVRAHTTGLELPRQLPLDRWLHLGEELRRAGDSSSWWAGDWLVYGRACYPGRYRQAMERTSLDYQTLRNYAWVAGKVARSRRRPELSFQHHQEVAALPPDEQDYWLGRAVEGSWSRAELRRRLRLGTDGGVPTPPRLRIRLDVDLSRWVFWQQAAESLESDVVTWLVSAADRAAGL